MLDKYRDATASVRGAVRVRVLRYFGLAATRRSLFDVLHAAGLGQADLVIALSRQNSVDADACAERLIGHPIVRLPPQRRGYVRPLVRERVGDDRLVTYFQIGSTTASGGAILPGSPMYDRLSVVRPGMSVLGLLSRGVTRRDVRIASRRGWLRLENERRAS